MVHEHYTKGCAMQINEKKEMEHEAEFERREKLKDEILKWKRNKIDVQTVSRIQLEEELKLAVRNRRLKELIDKKRIRFRDAKMRSKLENLALLQKEKEIAERDTLERLDGLRRYARQKLGVEVMPEDKTRLVQLTKSLTNRLKSKKHPSPKRQKHCSWSQEQLQGNMRISLEQVGAMKVETIITLHFTLAKIPFNFS